MFSLLLIFFYALLFFIAIPGVGALSVRGRWRNFRIDILNSLRSPLYDSNVAIDPDAGSYRYFGHLEALQGNDLLWVNNGFNSVSINMNEESIYILPANADLNLDLPFTGTVQKLAWEKAGILSQGLGVFVWAPLHISGGLPCFSRREGQGFLVILFDGDSSSVLPRSIWYGRQQNEYWNDFTPFSLLTGFVALISLAIIGFQDEANRLMAVLAAASSIIPFMPLMPPGILAFFLYRRLWRKGRSLRARKDLVQLGGSIMDSPEIGGKQKYSATVGDYQSNKPVSAKPRVYMLDIPMIGGSELAKEGILYLPKATTDPMALRILVQGDPLSRIVRAGRAIHGYEIWALLVLGLGLLVNYYLSLVLIIQMINYGWINIR